MQKKCLFGLIFLCILTITGFSRPSEPIRISTETLDTDGYIWLKPEWRYHPGDAPHWATPDIDDAKWPETDIRILPDSLIEPPWTGIGWFRTWLQCDSTLVNQPLGLSSFQAGAAEFYFDGELFHHIGQVSNSANKTVEQLDQNPMLLLFPDTKPHLLAVRYANHRSAYFHRKDAMAGFSLTIRKWDNAVTHRINRLRKFTRYKWAFSLIPLILALLHILLYCYYPRIRENFFYAGLLLGFTLLVYSHFHSPLADRLSVILFFNHLFFVSMLICSLFGLLLTYSERPQMPKQIYPISVGVLALCILIFVNLHYWVVITTLVVMFLLLFEVLRFMIFSRKSGKPTNRLTMVGFILLLVSIGYQVLAGFNLLPLFRGFEYAYLYGILAMLLTMSVNLAKEFAMTSRNLEQQLVQVKDLSQKTLTQERRQQKQEMEQRLLEAENQRQTLELEAARELQLSMLPEPLNEYQNLEIQFHMETASEVGGDYYDYQIAENGTLTLAIGDATGHGTKAGTMVAAIKSLFVANGGSLPLPWFFEKCSTTLRQMRFKNMFMGLQMLRFHNNSLQLISAGMPPVLIYRQNADSVETIEIKTLPLGAPKVNEFEQIEIGLLPGDTILLMSDGFPELFNESGEMLGEKRTKETFHSATRLPTAKIITELMSEAQKWRLKKPQMDDVTFIVIRLQH